MIRSLFAVSAIALAGVGVHFYIHQCPNLDRLAGAVVIITGASKGIGAELALQYARLGSHIVIAARRQAELKAVANQALENGAASATALVADMSDAADVESLIASTVSLHGHIDILVLNHAIIDEGLVVSYNTTALTSTLKDVLHTNLVGFAVAARAALPHLERTSGHIAVISSASAKVWADQLMRVSGPFACNFQLPFTTGTTAPLLQVAAPFHAFYVASKCGLNGFFETLRAELHLLHSKVTIGVQV
jgi:corticosteroid 11-beta-dehydrogenase isozyme 1